MNPVEVSRKIQNRVRNSIRKSLPVERSVPEMAPVLEEFFQDNPLAQDPFLELVPDYRPGASLADLARKGVITWRTAEIFANYFHGDEGGDPEQIRLHEHQAQAIREVCGNGKNLVVCSGTGSGKTECFLIPLVDELLREHQAGNLGPGVRAMILYPMNALVNDQIRRLRGVLRFAPEIRFGKFTGETEMDVKIRKDLTENAEDYESQLNQAATQDGARMGFDDEAALPHEVTTRRRWWAEPAHILVTNYAMLERLLLQPQDNSLFGAHWKHIVLDEAHCYSGALGTEIAWLIRRLKRRVEAAGTPAGSLRFLATSATLISDEITPEEKAARIRTEFASRLFPAAADSFAVQFGRLRDVPDQVAGAGLSAGQILAMGNENRIRRSQEYLGRRGWHDKLGKALGALGNENREVAIGDLLAILRMVNESVKSGLLGDRLNPLESGILPQTWNDNLTLLRNFLIAGIGPLNPNATWREWLHDDGDPRPSSIPGDTTNGQQHPVGNRLHLLAQWNQPPHQISLEALEWLISCACELAVAADLDAEPNALCVGIPNQVRTFLALVSVQLEAIADELTNEKNALIAEWNQAIEQAGANPQNDSFQLMLANALAEDPTVLRLKHHLRGAVDSEAGGDLSRMSAVAQAVFPGENDTLALNALTALISLGTLAKAAESRTPVLDARYHQLIRGVETPGLRLLPGDGGPCQVELLPQVMDDTLALGLCRDCGQPFALGYARELALNQPPHQLRASKGGDYRFLHAFAWVRGNAGDEDGRSPGLWVDTSSGCVGDDPYQAGNWVEVVVHQGPENNGASEFISRCPICGENQQNYAGSRYGIITPYEANGPQVRVVALEELARLSDESSDPAARNHPGSGRKLLVFSDSRSGAATLAWRLQEYTAETTMARLVVEAVNGNPAENLTAQEVLEVCGIPQTQWQGLLGLPVAIDGMRAGLGPTPNVLSIILRRKIEENNLSGLLAVSRMTIQNGNEIPNGDLSLTEAAQYRLIEALCKKGRNGILQRGLLRLSNQNLRGFKMPGMDMPPAQIEELLSDLVLLLLGRVRLILPDGFPSLEMNQYRKNVSQNGGNQTMRWEGGNANSLPNRSVRCALACYCDFWHVGLVAHLQALPGNANVRALAAALAGYQLNQIRLITEIVCSNPENRWMLLLGNLIPSGYANTPQLTVLRGIRSFFVTLANQLLIILWGPFTNAPNGLLVADPGGSFALDPMRLRLHPAPVAVNNEAQAGEEEDRELATRTIIPLRVEEHTAQIATERGSAYQRAFADGRVNILSCSTTFEMGVDLGDLNCVFLNGMPPAVANYRQRAGRAGRRPGSSSYALTFLGESSHDRYYWEHPGQLLFGPMDAPKIYLENPLFRARHLRAEAMHDFLDWLSQDNRATDPAAQRFDDDGQSQVTARRRKWSSAGDFFIGVAAGRAQNGQHPVIARFRPLVKELPAWHYDKRALLQQHIGGIADVGDPGYQVADDLVWQLLTQADGLGIQPYPNGDPEAYQNLGGPHIPDADDNDPRRRELQHQFGVEFGPIFDVHPRNINRYQNHLIHEQTVTWLTRGRVLPKYGFPVDVIKLMPDEMDFHGAHVKMERDLRIGLYEYAPGQVVTANKRRFPSAIALTFEKGNLVAAGGEAAIVRYLCDSCHEPDWGAHVLQGQNCRFCGNHGQLKAVNLCRPDAFRAKSSTAGSGVPSDRGAALHVHTGAFRQGIAVTGTALLAKESNSGTITYINQGPHHDGFLAGDHPRFSLYHDIRTDIAGWMLAPGLFANGGTLQKWSQQNHAGRNRLNAAMKSALQAILRAAARVKGIEDRDLGGLVQPGIHQNGEEPGFVIFDEAVGGGGAVLDLVLTGQPNLDAHRVALIRRILEHAVSLCEKCPCGELHIDPNIMPIDRLEFLAMAPQDQVGLRPATSCYRCLRSHRNQREHELLDRHDAAMLLTELLKPSVEPANALSRDSLSTTNNPPDAFEFLLDDGTTRQLSRMVGKHPAPGQWVLVQLPGGTFAYGTWMLMQHNTGQRLRLINGVGLEDGLNDPDLGSLVIWGHGLDA